eukprot:GHVR01037165.1.p1 GENE.GHVR01037165.1~~GHVR01037165.1.p1  ORF type:complete len:125 (+),score=13.93 GHVR01037165.1:27-401(+)
MLKSAKAAEPVLDEQEFLKLTSGDAHEFFCDKEIAMQCEVIKTMHAEELEEGRNGSVTFPQIDGRLLEKVIEYLYWKFKYTDCQKQPIPEFDIDDDIVLDLLRLAEFLGLSDNPNPMKEKESIL